MADTIETLDLVTLAQAYRGDVVRQVNRMSTLLRTLRVVAGEGKNVAWAPEADGQLAEYYSDGADAANFGSDAQASATLPWALLRSNMHVSQLAMDGSATSSSPEGNLSLWARNVVNSSAKLASKINSEMYAGSGGTGVVTGLGLAIGNTTNTYGTIDRTVSPANAYWLPTVVDPGTDTTTTFALIRADMTAIFIACGEQPTHAMVSPTLFNSIAANFDPTRRQVDYVLQSQRGRGGITLDFGYQVIEADGCMFLKDKDATAKTIFYLNENHVEIQYLPSPEQRMMVERSGMQIEADDGFGQIPLGFKYEKLAKTGASEKAQVLWTGQLVVNRPNACGVRLHAV